MIKLVALDLDGTIVKDSLEISPRTLKVLGHLITHTEVRVVLATGRMFPSTVPFARAIGIKEPLITYQGAMIRDMDTHRTLLHHAPIGLEVARSVLSFLTQESCHTNLYVEDQLFTSNTNAFATYYATISGVTPTLVEDLFTALTGPPTKIMAIEEARIDYIHDSLKEAFPEHISVCKSRKDFCEIIDGSASKWNAIQVLAQGWGIEPHEIMAIGDHGNDASMISQAGLGVAMGNATPELQAMANYVTRSIHEDGAAEAIERFVLNGESIPLRARQDTEALDGSAA